MSFFQKFAAACSYSSVAADPNLLFRQDWESTTSPDFPTGWSGTADPDSTDGPLAGSQSLRGSGSGAYGQYDDFGPQSEAFFYFVYSFDSFASAPGVVEFYNWTDPDATRLCRVRIINGGDTRVYNGDLSTAGTDTTPGDELSGGQTYHIWVRVKKGTGSNGEIDFSHSTTTTKPATPQLSLTNLTFTLDINRIRFPNVVAGPVCRWDNCMGYKTVLGDDPF